MAAASPTRRQPGARLGIRGAAGAIGRRCSLAGGAVRRLSGLPDEGAVLRAVRLRLQPAARLRRPAVVRPRRLLRRRPATSPAHAAKVWGLPPELGILAGTAAAAAARASSSALLAIRRQGIYFAMITLALAQMVYFFCLQAPFTGGEDGIQAVPRGKLFGLLDLHQRPDAVLRRAGDLPGRLPADLPHHPLAVRPGAEGDPRERAARDLARLRRRPLQAARLRAVGGARRAWPARTKAIVFQLATLTDVHWHDVGRGRADDAARRHRHHVRPGRRRRRRHRHAELPRRARLPG